MERAPDVLVIGGGVIGLTTAYLLARDGATVRLVDRGAFGAEASWAGAGIIPPGNPERARHPFDRLRAESSAAFPAFAAELRERTGIDNGYRVCGGIEFFPGGELESATTLWRSEGIEFAELDASRLRHLEPGLEPLGATIDLPGMAQVRNPWHLRALERACESVGVRTHQHIAIRDFRRAGARLIAALDESGTAYPAGRFLIAAGAWADSIVPSLGIRTGIHPVLGQIVLFRPPRPLLRRIVSVGKRYLVPRDDGRILAGATEEPEAGFEKRNTESGVAGLIDFACSLVPGLRIAEVERTWCGLRPGTPDGLPFLGPVPGFANAFVAGGHFRAGIQLSVATGRVMAELLTGRPPFLPLEVFALDRPPAEPFESAFRS